jgi:hypothetical protein
MQKSFSPEIITAVLNTYRFEVGKGLCEVATMHDALNILFTNALHTFCSSFEYTLLELRLPKEHYTFEDKKIIIKNGIDDIIKEAKEAGADSINILARLTHYSMKVLERFPELSEMFLHGEGGEWFLLKDLAEAAKKFEKRNASFAAMLFASFLNSKLLN